MKIHAGVNGRSAAVGAGVLAIALASLTACGSDNNTSSSSGGSSSTSSAAGGSSSPASGSSSSASGATGGAINCANGTLSGQGSSAQATAITQFIKDYQTKCGSGTNISYNGNGSGPGVTAFVQKQADWAGSDYPLNADQQKQADQRCGGKAVSVGTIPGAIAVMYNVPGVDKLNLSASTLGKIYTGKITKWNDQAIATENPGVSLPDLAIQAYHRSDASGTSFNFSNYLNKTAAADFPTAANKQWPASTGQAAQGSKGVAQAVQSTAGAVGYAEVSYATSNNLKTAAIGNAQGKFVPLTIANASNFISKAQVDTADGNYKFNFDYTYAADDAYPAVLVTYEIVCSTGNDSAKLPVLKNFLQYTAGTGAQSQLEKLGYVALSSDQQTKVGAIFAGLS
ncbi:phosphate ABC transporter substrate-binding protein PstS [Catenulispora subtropica]|uniref:Phosphate-binding protein n=1 Tax=Catenulispora subtropica TaxID=450798 RepID=A0ABP5EJW7_9ACTN